MTVFSQGGLVTAWIKRQKQGLVRHDDNLCGDLATEHEHYLGQWVVTRGLNKDCDLIPIVFQKDCEQCTGSTRGTE